ncbi:Far11p [Sporobolomyces salmoneus]|uniref:Far11p n=1 Tax=Sporobolomyces salmoneus TaxID=183962 RepID=UPI00317699C8
MSDPPTIQPLVTASAASSTSPPKADLPSLRQRSFEQAQEELSNRTQSPTRSAKFDLIKGRRNAVDASNSQTQSTTTADQQTKPPLPTMSTPVTTNTGSGATIIPPRLMVASNAAGAAPPPPQQQHQQQQQQAAPTNAPQPPASNLPPRPKQTVYTFPSPPPDTADLLSELEEFYSYVEVPQVLDHKKDFEDWFEGEKEFSECTHDYQISTIRNLLSSLTSPTSDSPSRSSSARHLLHIAHGAFSANSSSSPEHHLHLVLSNCRLLREAGALELLWDAIKRATSEWETISGVPPHSGGMNSQQDGEEDQEDGGGPYHPQQRNQPPVMLTEEEEEKERIRQEKLDEINAELATLLAVVYFMVECFRGEDQWGQELMALKPPMPIHLFNLVAGLREKNAKGYPVKKLLLLLWKSLLCTIGGMKDVERVKVLVREIEGLPKDDPNFRPSYRPWTKATIPSLLSFRNENLSKYPTYTPLAPSQLLPLPPQMSALSSDQSTLDRISAAAAPIPIKPTFSYHINANHDPSLPSNQYVPTPPGSAPPPAHWQPATPAPSPPPSPAPQISALPLQQQGGPQPPKPKKQQYQTDQTRPFPLPFAPSNYAKGRSVPRSIEEASELFRRDLRVSSEIWQGWKIREEFRSEEMGWGRAEQVEREMVRDGNNGEEKNKQQQQQRGMTRGMGQLRRRMEELAVAQGESEEAVEDGNAEEDEEEEEEDQMDPLTVLKNMGRQLKKEQEQLGEDDQKKRKELEERRAHLQRLERVELLYRHTLANLQSAVIVLLKLLLATVTANQNLPNAANANNLNGEGATEPPPDLSLEDCDILRHREITSKAVSAILILTLKWFKASHVMKFHYFSQLLVDSNCLLLILKMFGLQEVSTLVRVKHDRPEHNFFKFCHDSLHPSDSSSPRPEDLLLSLPPPGDRSVSPDGGSSYSNTATATSANGSNSDDDVELITDYSWRNFFSTINFVHILQKLTKRKTHRVLLMVQYKSSAILKRILKVSHPTLQLYVLKVIKSQVPYCGRKWRQSNMKVITAIYLHVRPDLRDEWLAGVDVDADVEESLPHEQALRALVKFFNTKHYGKYAPHLHRRSSAGQDSPELHSQPAGSAPLSPAPLPASHANANGFPSLSPQYDPDVFPPSRSISSIDVEASDSMRLAYGGLENLSDSEFIGFEVDDLLSASDDPNSSQNGAGTAGADGDMLDWLNDPLGASDAAWEKLGLEGYEGEWDDISDSESTGSWGFMRFGLDGQNGAGVAGEPNHLGGEEAEEKRRNQWEHISPETITALEEERAAAQIPNSPRPMRRRSSSGNPVSPALRPVLFDREDEPSSAGGPTLVDEEEGPIPFEEHTGPAIDEVELVFHR